MKENAIFIGCISTAAAIAFWWWVLRSIKQGVVKTRFGEYSAQAQPIAFRCWTLLFATFAAR
jgi:hypothetical protein